MNTDSSQEKVDDSSDHTDVDSSGQDLSGFQMVSKKHSFRTDSSEKKKTSSGKQKRSFENKKKVSKPVQGSGSSKNRYLETLQLARETALSELKLSTETLKDKEFYKKTVLYCQNDIWKNDEIDIKREGMEEMKFSRHKFYLKRDFKNDLDKYYRDLGYSFKLILVRGNRWILNVRENR